MGLTVLLLAGCQRAGLDPDQDGTAGGNVIHMGGVSTGELSVSLTKTGEVNEDEVQRTDAENIPWLRGVLFNGLDITYGKADRSVSSVAQLMLLADANGTNGIKYSDGNLAEYSFLYRDADGALTEKPALWYDNGSHFFEGLHVPGRITTGHASFPSSFTTDQHDDATGTTESELGNYTLLSHYLAMPANFRLNATVGRIKLPFRHRLSRVLAYILIDPSMGSDVKIQGYSLTDGKDDPRTTQIHFCNVNVLGSVNASENTTTHLYTYTPQWTQVRKATPHFVGERASYDDAKNQVVGGETTSFIAYYDTEKKEYIYPTDARWTSLHALSYDETTQLSSNKAYQRISFGMVPVYDLIVRPTYTTLNNVMFDEDLTGGKTRQDYYVATNQIEFEVTLSNGLNYSKRFIFDLDANYETVVYLHINRERVDYNSSGSILWEETTGSDDYYGVNNQNGNTLSFAGSGWQRAYTNSNTNYTVTDGHQYLQDEEDKYAQYVDNATWIEMFREAREGGLHHGDYFILANNISIPAAALPESFVFTGHLDGLDHTITLTSADYTKVTQRAYDSYESYTNDSGTEQKYIRLEDGSYQKVPSDAAYYTLEGETYTLIPSIVSYTGASAYAKDSEEEETYTLVNFYKKVHHAEVTETVPGVTPSHLFYGLNGNYTTAQESDVTATWEANVHWEKRDGKNYWVPYKTDDDGWRAEVINTRLAAGATLFSTGAAITGYVNNCWQGSPAERVPDYTPSLPEY